MKQADVQFSSPIVGYEHSICSTRPRDGKHESNEKLYEQWEVQARKQIPIGIGLAQSSYSNLFEKKPVALVTGNYHCDNQRRALMFE